MKKSKILLLTLWFCLLFFMVGCGEEKADDGDLKSIITAHSWKRINNLDCAETLYFGENGDYAYYCACGNGVYGHDVYDTYRCKASKNEIIVSGSAPSSVIKVLEYSEEQLKLEIEGHVGVFAPEDIPETTKKTVAEGPTIWIMGDSLAAANPKNQNAEGWGEMLQLYFKGDVDVRNAAASGASASSYIDIGSFDMTVNSLKKGDYVIIQFGHNDVWYEDKYTDPYGSSSDEGSFKWILKERYINSIIEKGAHPILATSVVTWAFNEEGRLYDMLYADHARAMRELVDECAQEGIKVDLIDTYALTETMYNRLGPAESWKFHNDEVHYNNYGAAYMAGIIAQQMKLIGISCCRDIYTFQEVAGTCEDLEGMVEIDWENAPGIQELKLFRVNDRLYYGTEETGPMGDAGCVEGKITSTVSKGTIPTENGQSNFGCEGSSYTLDDGDGRIQVRLEDDEYHFFYFMGM